MMAGDGVAQKERTTFKLTYTVSTSIAAAPETVWGLLTDAHHFLDWNSTLSSLEGQISLGGRVKMTVPEAPGRIFTVKVSEFAPNRRLVWRDGFMPMFQGVRTFTLESLAQGKTRFTMSEAISGILLPMIANQLPNFVPIFERYAVDLKKAAEVR
jgi:hypothetical protein